MSNTMIGRDIWMRHTDKEGRIHVQQHRVWDALRFVTSCIEAAASVKGKAAAQQITREQYLAEGGK